MQIWKFTNQFSTIRPWKQNMPRESQPPEPFKIYNEIFSHEERLQHLRLYYDQVSKLSSQSLLEIIQKLPGFAELTTPSDVIAKAYQFMSAAENKAIDGDLKGRGKTENERRNWGSLGQEVGTDLTNPVLLPLFLRFFRDASLNRDLESTMQEDAERLKNVLLKTAIEVTYQPEFDAYVKESNEYIKRRISVIPIKGGSKISETKASNPTYRTLLEETYGPSTSPKARAAKDLLQGLIGPEEPETLALAQNGAELFSRYVRQLYLLTTLGFTKDEILTAWGFSPQEGQLEVTKRSEARGKQEKELQPQIPEVVRTHILALSPETIILGLKNWERKVTLGEAPQMIYTGQEPCIDPKVIRELLPQMIEKDPKLRIKIGFAFWGHQIGKAKDFEETETRGVYQNKDRTCIIDTRYSESSATTMWLILHDPKSGQDFVRPIVLLPTSPETSALKQIIDVVHEFTHAQQLLQHAKLSQEKGMTTIPPLTVATNPAQQEAGAIYVEREFLKLLGFQQPYPSSYDPIKYAPYTKTFLELINSVWKQYETNDNRALNKEEINALTNQMTEIHAQNVKKITGREHPAPLTIPYDVMSMMNVYGADRLERYARALAFADAMTESFTELFKEDPSFLNPQVRELFIKLMGRIGELKKPSDVKRIVFEIVNQNRQNQLI